MQQRLKRLTRDMYRNPESMDLLFGLCNGQMRGHEGKLVHNGGWYNRQGEKLGWGDLSREDFLRILKELQDGEQFIVLGERASFLNFVVFNPGPNSENALASPDEQAPGVDYIAKHCRYLIAKSIVYKVSSDGAHEEGAVSCAGLTMTRLDLDKVKQMLES